MPVPDTDWFVCPMEPRVRHLVRAADDNAPLPALCQVESPAWRPLGETDGASRPCPLCTAVESDSDAGPRERVKPPEPPLPWGQPGDVRGR